MKSTISNGLVGRDGRVGPIAVIAALTLLSLPFESAHATLIEGFENGLTHDSTVGDASIQLSYFGIDPTQATHQLALSTINFLSDPGYTPISGSSSAASAVAIANFLGIPTGTIRDGLVAGQEGAAFQINLGTLNAGDVITFDYNFLTDEVQPGAHNDFAFYTLGLPGNTPIVADTFSGLLHPTTGMGNPFVLETGYHGFSITIGTAGMYTLGIGVVDGTTTDVPSALLLDNIQLLPVPEPSTLALALVGAWLLFAARRLVTKRSI
ncbi:MAG: PEP-CTERM sorting domain-containing protein [Chthoniobacterales bacterium]